VVIVALFVVVAMMMKGKGSKAHSTQTVPPAAAAAVTPPPAAIPPAPAAPAAPAIPAPTAPTIPSPPVPAAAPRRLDWALPTTLPSPVLAARSVAPSKQPGLATSRQRPRRLTGARPARRSTSELFHTEDTELRNGERKGVAPVWADLSVLIRPLRSP
jgi:hypothetical protein